MNLINSFLSWHIQIVIIAFAFGSLYFHIYPLYGQTMENGTIQVGKEPERITYAPTNKMLYVTNINDGNISVIDTTTNELNKTIELGHFFGPRGITYVPSKDSIYVVDN